jgi:phage shock protein A
MSYFSRLSDIVTCNLSNLLEQADDPQTAVARIVSEMNEGLAGAKRSVATALHAETQLARELEEHRALRDEWNSKAKVELSAGREDQAREALVRKQEVADLIAGLEQQYHAAEATREHLETTLRAIEARLAEAARKQQQLAAAEGDKSPGAEPSSGPRETAAHLTVDNLRTRRIDAELDELKRELGQS